VNNQTTKPTTLKQWLAYIEALHPKSIEMGLDRVNEVASNMALESLPPVISIAGTNGKGSTCAMLEHIYSKAGYRVGAYVSPHLLHYNERVRVNQQNILDDDLCLAFSAVEAARSNVVLTYFEMGTLAALWHFSKENLDVILLEVGMGGRLDAVNAFEPSCSIVTSIDLDHTDYLGDTREKIGVEKAGIYRNSKPAICGDDDPPKSLVRHADEIGANLLLIHRDFEVIKTDDGWIYQTGQHQLSLPALALQGDFQLNNAACAICAVQSLASELPVTFDAIKNALANVTLLGRFYTISKNPEVILDVAHNPQAAKSLAQNLIKHPANGHTLGVFAMLADKDIEQVTQELLPYISAWYLADTQNPRGAKAIELESYLLPQAEGRTKCFDTVTKALQCACIDMGKNDRIIVFGSFYTVADAIEVLTAQGK
jgi:dihydrofolate synthase/folylpolyglutamate synthase